MYSPKVFTRVPRSRRVNAQTQSPTEAGARRAAEASNKRRIQPLRKNVLTSTHSSILLRFSHVPKGPTRLTRRAPQTGQPRKNSAAAPRRAPRWLVAHEELARRYVGSLTTSKRRAYAPRERPRRQQGTIRLQVLHSEHPNSQRTVNWYLRAASRVSERLKPPGALIEE